MKTALELAALAALWALPLYGAALLITGNYFTS